LLCWETQTAKKVSFSVQKREEKRAKLTGVRIGLEKNAEIHPIIHPKG